VQITATNIKPQIRERLDKGLDSQAFRGMAYEEHRLGDCAEFRSFREDYAWASNLLTRVRNQKPDQSEVKISGPQLAEMGLSYPGRTQVVAQSARPALLWPCSIPRPTNLSRCPSSLGTRMAARPAWKRSTSKNSKTARSTPESLNFSKKKTAAILVWLDSCATISIMRTIQNPEASTDLLARAQGALVGLLVGDALGTTLEFSTPRGLSAIRGGGPLNLLPGQITDDGEMALTLARTLVAQGGFSQVEVLRSYRAWLDSRPFGVGETILRALSRVNPKDPDPDGVRAAANANSQSNGALMRCAPLAIWGHRLDSDELGQRACEEASLTHPHPICQQVNAVFVCTLARAIAPGDSPDKLFRYARERALAWNFNWLDWFDQSPESFIVQSSWVKIAFSNAFQQLKSGQNFAEALQHTVAQGGDTHTNAAIAGALLGAAYGLQAIPAHWQSQVLQCQPRRWRPWIRRGRPPAYWPGDALKLAEQLVALAPNSDILM